MSKAPMSTYDAALMLAPSLTPGWCIVCGKPYPTEHHPVKRSHGGTDGPVLHLCGSGTTGCHGKAESRRLHFRYSPALEMWSYLETREPTKYETTLSLSWWQFCNREEVA